MKPERGAVVVVVAVAVLVVAAVAGIAWWAWSRGGEGVPVGDAMDGQGLTATPAPQPAVAAGTANASPDEVPAALTAVLDRLPADSVAAVVIADLPGWRKSFATTEAGRLFADPEIHARIEQVVAAAGDETKDRQMVEQAVAVLSELDELGVRSLALSAFPLASGDTPFGVALVAGSDDPQRLLDWLHARLADAGEAPEPTPGEAGGVAFSCVDDGCVAQRGDAVMLAMPRAAIEHALAAAGELGRDPRMRAALGATGARATGSFGFVDARAAAVLARAHLAADAAGGDAEIEPMMKLVGADSWDFIAIADAARDELFQARAVFRYQRATAGLLGVLLDTPGGTPTVDRMLPAAVSAATVGRLDDPAATWDRVLGEIRAMLPEAERGKLDQQLAMTRMLGFDLRDDLFATFGGELGIGYDFDSSALLDAERAAQALSSMRMQLVVGVVDQPRLEALLARLDAFGVVAATHPIADGKMRELAVPVEGLAPAVALASGHLVLGSHAADVRAALDGTLTSLADDARYRAARARIPSEGGWFSYQATASSVRFTDLVARLRQELASGDRQQEAAYNAVSAVAGAIESYIEATGAPPAVYAVADLEPLLVPEHTDELMLVDGWGHELGYAVADGGYVLWSPGRDGQLERDWTGCASGCPELIAASTDHDADLVAAGGSFVRWPDPDAAGDQVPAELDELARALDRRIAELSPSAAVITTTADGLAYDMTSPMPMMVLAAAGATAAMAMPALTEQDGEDP